MVFDLKPPKGAEETPKSLQRSPKRPLRGPKRSPRDFQNAPKFIFEYKKSIFQKSMNVSARIKVFEVRRVILEVQNRPQQAPRDDKKTTSKNIEQEDATRGAIRTTKKGKISFQNALTPSGPTTRILRREGSLSSLVG